LDQLTAPGAEAAWRLVEWAGLYAGEGNFAAALRCLDAALAAQPDYFPAEEQRAEFLAIAGRYDEAEVAFADLDARFPANRQILLKRARALGWGRRYDDSLATYDALRALNPADPVPLLEQARVAGWAKDRARAAAHYGERWTLPVDLRLARGLLAAPGHRPHDEVERRWREWAAERVAEGDRRLAADEPPFGWMEFWAQAGPGEGVNGEFTAPADWPEAWVELRLELWADLLLQRAFWLENRAKQLAWDRRWIRAEETYTRLLATSPGNQEAWFDLSQVQAAQGLGHRERASLAQLLTLDANNSLAGRALFRRERRSEPFAHLGGRWYEESGRDQLASIRRQELRLGGELTADDRHRLHLDLWRSREQATAGVRERFFARGLELRGATVLNEHLAADASWTRRQYTSPRIRAMETWNLAVWGTLTDGARVGLGGETRPEAANAFAVRRGVRAQHAWLGGELPLGRRADLTGRIDRLLYNDGNRGTHLWIAPAYTWTEHPRTFRTILTLEARDTDEASRYLFSPPGELTDIIHPYWTPRDYVAAALTLLWRHDLAREFFIGAPEHWYEVRTTFNLGNDRNYGGNLEADYAREWRDRWVLRAGLALSRSREWDATAAHLRFGRRF
jgi:tetratricopeptide (TPR) repeat protein